MSRWLVRAAIVTAVSIGVVAGSIAPAAAAPASANAGAGIVHAQGEFIAAVDFASLALRDVRGGRCELTVNGTLTFTGTLDGAATGTTTALLFATCAEVAVTPPGTFFDVFRFEGDFTGAVAGQPAAGPLRYAGITRVGGAIDALITLGGSSTAVLRADAVVAVGGSYTGVAVP